ncbi:MAG: mandelate racemase/muconate lactonizing enzyme family protein [Oribacterium sp.]|nr:mandelate racemase/muconate lactonizing enzyme family protein [Oribacterium sp.]MDY6306713.1 mandelate racemase/muconate lactonizing enzyme family protein [Oribacterium sp.]MDY6317795.1 mandelate racemase/muconate lactonizing enzyme family protein [Oribacterium sp.]
MSMIAKIRTIRLSSYPNIIWIELETDEGIKGLGEAWRGAAAIEAVIAKDIAPWLKGQDARNIERISRTLLNPYVGFHSGSAEIRAASAVDIALWDLFGKRHGISIAEALGGYSRDKIEVYNTCSGYSFNAGASNINSGASRREITEQDTMQGPYDDQIAFTRDAGALAKSLLKEGYHAMKIWPFDPFAKNSNGNNISLEDLEKGTLPFRKIREAVGNQIEVMCELHSLWNLPSAKRILEALEPYHIFWAEDPLCKMDDAREIARLRQATDVPICGSETLASSVIFLQMLEQNAFDYVMVDLSWCGGLTEARKIAYLADANNLPIAPHDCTGPVLLFAGLQLGLHAGNGLYQEVVRANLSSWYKDMVTDLPEIQDGFALAPKKPGLGTALRKEVYERADAIIKEY